jgi:hypothetical protein
VNSAFCRQDHDDPPRWDHDVRRPVPLPRSFSSSIAIAFLLVTVALITAALSSATLLYDGAFFLFHAVDSQQIQIPQMRITFGVLQWPVVLATHVTDSFPVLRAIYSIPLVIAPLVGLSLSWWVVRRDHPHLIIWPALGILIVDLPGQMHWIATSIRTNQLFWPILLAVMIGLPDRTIPMVGILLVLVLFLHPQVAVFLIAAALAALFLAWRTPDLRKRMLSVAGVFLFCAIYRASVMEIGYETSEASTDNQMKQWTTSVLGYPAWALLGAAIAALALMLRPRVERLRAPLAIVAIAGLGACGVLLAIWGSDASTWRHAIDYRGPSMLHSLVLMGLAFLDRALPSARENLRQAVPLRMAATNLAALIFCVVITLQCFSWRGELATLRTTMAGSPTACVPTSRIPGFATSPLNFWSLPPASIMLQGPQPDHVVLPDSLCREASSNGLIPMSLVDPGSDTVGSAIDMFHLRAQVTDRGACWGEHGDGWYPVEISGSDRRRWTDGRGEVRFVLNDGGAITLSGVVESLEAPNEIKITVNGQTQRSILLEGDPYATLDGIQLQLQSGGNSIEFVSMRRAGQADGDPRDLAISVINLDATLKNDGSPCTWADA